MNLILPTQFESVFKRPESPFLIDVRSPGEFREGSIPGSINLPVLSDDERHLVGKTYTEQGPEAALALGHQLVGGLVKETRVDLWAAAIAQNPEAAIFCLRGGLRSQIAQRWLQDRGIAAPIVSGGYKALRGFLIEVIDRLSQALDFLVIAGPTGSGKTRYLYESGEPFLDLEKLANHRGSAFGGLDNPQPTQVNFENALALALLNLNSSAGPILIEDESRSIGKCKIPESLFEKMTRSPRRTLEVPLDKRISNILEEYVAAPSINFDRLRTAIHSIAPRLGGARATEILADLKHSEQEHALNQGLDSNRVWIQKLLDQYYDPLYRRSYPDFRHK